MTGNNTSNGFLLFKNQTANNVIAFTPHNFGVGDPVSDAIIADMDGDGKNDVVLSNSTISRMMMLRNNSADTISFAAPVKYIPAREPRHFVIGDLNGDGKPETAVNASLTDNLVCVLKNTSITGSISALPYKTYSVGNGNYDIVLADFNGDGKPDILTGNTEGTSMSMSYLQSNLNLQYQTPAVVTAITDQVGDWDNPLVWIDDQVPPQGSSVIIRNNIRANVNRLCTKITVNPSANLNVISGVKLTVLQ